jgi:hypothetical protein
MRVTGQASAAATGRLVLELKPDREDERHHAFEKRLAIAKQLNVGRFIPKIDGDRAVFSGRFDRYAHVSPLCYQVSQADETHWG